MKRAHSQKLIEGSLMSVPNGSATKRTERPVASAKKPVMKSNLKAAKPPAAAAQPNPKLITLQQLKDIARDLYASKKSQDAKCMSSGLPLETLEQHLFSFLSTRFGLKSLVIEWTESILGAIQTFARDDHEVALLGKTLQNEIDEDFRLVQSEVKKTLAELVKVQIRDQYPKKNERFVQEEQALRTGGSIARQEAELILESVLKPEDYPVVKTHLLAE